MYENATANTGRAQGLAAGAGPQALDEAPVYRTLGQLVIAQNATSDRLTALLTRLEPFLTPPAPVAESKQAAMPAASQFDEALQLRVYAEWSHADRLDDIIRRLSI